MVKKVPEKEPARNNRISVRPSIITKEANAESGAHKKTFVPFSPKFKV